MSYKNKVIECLKKSLSHEICANTNFKLEQLNERVTSTGEISYRLQDKNGKPIKSLDELAALINVDEGFFTTTLNSSNRYTNLSTSITFTPTNVILHIHEDNPEDNEVRNDAKAFGDRRVSFTLAYMNDNDKDLPMKLIYYTTREVEEDAI